MRSIGWPWAIPAAIAIAIVAFVSGCGQVAGAAPVSYPAGCDSFGFSARRCAAIVDRARETAGGRLAGAPVSIGLEAPDESTNRLGGGEIARVVFGLADGTRLVEPVVCVGVPAGPGDAVCQEPRLVVTSSVSHDVPCTGEPPAGCPSQIVPDARAVDAARPLRLATTDIPIAGHGRQAVELGTVGLPNGYVSRIEAHVVNDQPSDFWVADATVRLELRPADPTRPPFGDVYERPLVDGVEEATAWLVFDVTEASPGAVLHLADIVIE